MIRINDEIMREISQILRADVKDPRIGLVTTVLKVDTTSDLKYCKVYISILGNEDEKKNVMEGIEHAKGYIRSMIASRINLRQTPELTFIQDDSLEYGFKIDKILKEINKEE